jgi:uncharacterized membrane protein YkvA (DUF1232 family)
MTLVVTLEFSEAELEYFRSLMLRVRKRTAQRPAEEIMAAATAEVERLRANARSPFVARRIDRVAQLIAMVRDAEWALPEPARRRVLDGLAYVAEARDLVPDNLPVLGLVDDAIMLELLLRDLLHELDAYEEFDAYRRDEASHRDRRGIHAPVSTKDWLDARREALHARMRERRERDLATHGGSLGLITHF